MVYLQVKSGKLLATHFASFDASCYPECLVFCLFVCVVLTAVETQSLRAVEIVASQFLKLRTYCSAERLINP